MAVYKVIQDIESEDKLLGPLTLKGFIYAIIAVGCGFISFRLMMATGLGPVRWLIIPALVFPMLLFGLLASPLGRQQPTEVWLLARVRFMLKPRKRIWSQSGLIHMVRITVPKKIEKQRTKDFSETEVKSRLETLATTLDSRGWAIKNVTITPSRLDEEAESDRLVAPTTISNIDANIEVRAADDIMDAQNNPTAQYLSSLMDEADAHRRTGVANRLNVARQQVAAAGPVSTKPRTDKKTDSNSVTPSSRADTLELAQSGNDFSVATLSKLANRNGSFQQLGPNEGVLSLH